MTEPISTGSQKSSFDTCFLDLAASDPQRVQQECSATSPKEQVELKTYLNQISATDTQNNLNAIRFGGTPHVSSVPSQPLSSPLKTQLDKITAFALALQAGITEERNHLSGITPEEQIAAEKDLIEKYRSTFDEYFSKLSQSLPTELRDDKNFQEELFLYHKIIKQVALTNPFFNPSFINDQVQKFKEGNSTDASIAALHKFVSARRAEIQKGIEDLNQLPESTLLKEQAMLDALFVSLFLKINPEDKREATFKNYLFLRQYGYTREKEPSTFSLEDIYNSAAIGINLLTGLYNLSGDITGTSKVEWDVMLPLNPFTGNYGPLSPQEKEQIALVKFLEDVALGVAVALPDPPTSSSSGDLNFTKISVGDLGGLELTTQGWKYVVKQLLTKRFEAQNMSATATAQIPLSGSSFVFGSDIATRGVQGTWNTAKLMLINNEVSKSQETNAQSVTLAKGEDGDECSTNPATDIMDFRLEHPGTTLTDEEILKLICATRPEGPNNELFATFNGAEQLREIDLKTAAAVTAYNRNLWVMGDVDTMNPASLISGGALILATPFLTHPDGDFNLKTDYTNEGIGLLSYAISLGRPDLRRGAAMLPHLWYDAEKPNFYVNLGQFYETNKNNEFLPKITAANAVLYMETGVDTFKYLMIGREMGKIASGYKADGETLEQIQQLALPALTLVAFGKRVYENVDARNGDPIEIKGVSASEVESLQERYEPKTAAYPLIPEILVASALFGGGVWGYFSAPSETEVSNNPFAGEIFSGELELPILEKTQFGGTVGPLPDTQGVLGVGIQGRFTGL